MTSEEQRIAIAEACGWKAFSWEKPSFNGHLIAETPEGNTGFMPDYLNDLNAMHEAEKILTDDQRWEQIKLLTDWKPAPAGFPLIGRFQAAELMDATAAQRAESFLRTLNLWKL